MHLLELQENFQFFLETLDIWSNFGCEHSKQAFSQITHPNRMNFSQISYMCAVELHGFFQFFVESLSFWLKFESDIQIKHLSNYSPKWNETLPDQSQRYVQFYVFFIEYSGQDLRVYVRKRSI